MGQDLPAKRYKVDLILFLHHFFIIVHTKVWFIQAQPPGLQQGNGTAAQMLRRGAGGSGRTPGQRLSSPDVAGMGAGAPCGRRGRPDVAGVGTDKPPDVRQGVRTGPDVAGMGEVARLESGVVQMWPRRGMWPLFYLGSSRCVRAGIGAHPDVELEGGPESSRACGRCLEPRPP